MTEVTTIQEAYNAVRPFRLIIAGTRTFADYNLLREKCDYLLSNKERVQIISGANVRWEKGELMLSADLCGVLYALERGYTIVPFPADWEAHGKPAGPIRNKQMAEYADALVLFHNGSPGSLSMLSEARKAGVKVVEVKF